MSKQLVELIRRAAAPRPVAPRPVPKVAADPIRPPAPTVAPPPPASSAPAAPAVPPPAAPAPTPLPWDTAYEQTVGNINKGRDNALAQNTYQANQLGQSYGYSLDPVSGAVAEDPTNPFSKAALLRQSYERSRAGTTNGMAARGQLYSGALQNAQNYNALNYTQSSDTNQRDFRNAAQSLLQGRLDTNTGADSQIDQAGWSRYDRAIAYAQAHPQDPGIAPKQDLPPPVAKQTQDVGRLTLTELTRRTARKPVRRV